MVAFGLLGEYSGGRLPKQPERDRFILLVSLPTDSGTFLARGGRWARSSWAPGAPSPSSSRSRPRRPAASPTWSTRAPPKLLGHCSLLLVSTRQGSFVNPNSGPLLKADDVRFLFYEGGWFLRNVIASVFRYIALFDQKINQRVRQSEKPFLVWSKHFLQCSRRPRILHFQRVIPQLAEIWTSPPLKNHQRSSPEICPVSAAIFFGGGHHPASKFELSTRRGRKSNLANIVAAARGRKNAGIEFLA